MTHLRLPKTLTEGEVDPLIQACDEPRGVVIDVHGYQAKRYVKLRAA